ncbi:spore coat protein JB [Cytobacillus horneckiae]|uniref:Spore coat protein CotJB n=1 Tax=Cytobacillus horneckiae TaxID=549687 RepID=A0A2N0ZCV3_9BACI|nr:spore coat protein CotJB [Cytobacillus horneckiae]NRG43819.1 spore coat protein CotJB [Bacillus sp. CRN 9]MBN6888391.1 spore coat protein CotJB [Cytobacillus horneckiae]MCM3180118.1 spore coat protein CotJB [Cytobacillus horneckiae]MEC1156569.1 spore coat protein CotJB [Cytobacillus horneckiae]MED2938906.1 spore coat protein CotJB [Cytobacillus horneckiae]
MKQLPPEYYELLENLQAVDFVLVELTLYLDTHNNDQDAINQFNYFAKERKKIKKEYESKYGPLLQFGNSYSGSPWNWDDAPWPWQV